MLTYFTLISCLVHVWLQLALCPGPFTCRLSYLLWNVTLFCHMPPLLQMIRHIGLFDAGAYSMITFELFFRQMVMLQVDWR